MPHRQTQSYVLRSPSVGIRDKNGRPYKWQFHISTLVEDESIVVQSQVEEDWNINDAIEIGRRIFTENALEFYSLEFYLLMCPVTYKIGSMNNISARNEPDC